ncbi:MAG TPA: hypothetical protein PLK37_13240 [Terricaulis sp.]|nr:hypothetical protein [Terricaulis sp.]
MKRISLIWALLAASLLASCDQIRLEPKAADSAPPPAAVEPTPDFSSAIGAAYPDFIARPVFQRYSATELGLSGADQARFAAAMTQAQPSWVASGGGARALLFTSCPAEGCAAGRAVTAIDMATGAAFVGVRDGAGATELVPNPRLEALLRLSAPDRVWHNPQPPPAQAQTP